MKRKTETKIENCTDLTGKILLAVPSVNNYRFGNCVIYLCGHDENGALGIIINKKIRSLSLNDLVRDHCKGCSKTGKHNAEVYFGGPIEVQRGFVLHSKDKSFASTVNVDENVSMTSTVDVLEAIMEGKGPKEYLISIGFMQWGAGDLEAEINKNYWIVQPSNNKILFDAPPDKKWQILMDEIGIKKAISMSLVSGHA